MICKEVDLGLGKGTFSLFLQPKHDAQTGEIIGAEALSRFVTDDNNIIMPIDYINRFEESGFITKFDFYMLEQVCILLSDWESVFEPSVSMLPISVNFSKITLEVPDFTERLESIVQKYNIPTNMLEIEITETKKFNSGAFITQFIDKLRNNGFRVTIDDYGMNSSAFSIIRHADVDILKIDREIIIESERSSKTALIFKSVVELCKKLNIKVVAEGVETENQLNRVKDIGCDIIQGWYFSKALSIKDFTEYVMQQA